MSKKSDTFDPLSFSSDISQSDDKSVDAHNSDHEKFAENRSKSRNDKSNDAYNSDNEKFHENRSKFRNDPEKMKIMREKRFQKALIEEEHEVSEEPQPKRKTKENQVINLLPHMVEVGHAERPVPPTIEVGDVEKPVPPTVQIADVEKPTPPTIQVADVEKPVLPTIEVGDFEKLVSPTDEVGDDQNEQIQELEFVNPFTLRRDVRFVSSANNNIATDFRAVLQDVEYFMFERTCFGIYLNIPDCSHQGHIHRCIREFQVFQPYDDQLWISVHGKLLKFTLYEFALITGLKCTGNEEDFDFTSEPTCRLITRYFRDRASVTKGLLLDAFDKKRWLDNHNDAVKISILVFISTFILSQTVDAVIPPKYFHLVENGSYANYPWGKVAFNELMRCYNKVLDPGAKCNRLNGMPYALQVWIYECCGQVPKKLAVHENDWIPRILNWRVVAKKLQYKDAKVGLFGQCVFENIAPTVNELACLSWLTAPSRVDIVSFEPGQVVPGSTEHVSTSEPGQLVPASTVPESTSEVSVGFEDFTYPPPPISFHRPASEGGTSSEPPKKKRKMIPIQKKVTRNQTRRPKVSLQSPKDQPIPESPEDVDHVEHQHLDDVSMDAEPVEHSQSESQNDDDSRGKTDAAANLPTEQPSRKREIDSLKEHSCINAAVDFISRENVNESIRLTEEVRKLSRNHDAKEDKLKVKKMIVHAKSQAVDQLEKTLLNSEAGIGTGLSKSSSISKSINSMPGPSTPISPSSVSEDLSSIKTSTREEYVAPSANEKPRAAEVNLCFLLPVLDHLSSPNKAMPGPSVPKSSEDLSSRKTVKREEYVSPNKNEKPRTPEVNLRSPIPVLDHLSSANKAITGPRMSKSSSVLGSSKTVKGEEFVTPSEDVNPRTAEVNLHSPLPVLSANKAQESASVPSQELKQSINIQDVESTSHTIQSFLKSLPEKYSSPSTGLQSNSTSSTQTLAKLIFECSIRLPLEALALDPMNEKEMCSAIAVLNENPSSLFSDEQAKQLVKLKYEFPVMVSKWRHLAQAEARDQDFLTSFEEDREKLNDWSRLDETLKSEYAKREEQARELEALLQTIRTRQKEITEERHDASHEAQKLMLLVQEKVGKTESTSTELETTKMQMNGLRGNWSNFQSKFP